MAPLQVTRSLGLFGQLNSKLAQIQANPWEGLISASQVRRDSWDFNLPRERCKRTRSNKAGARIQKGHAGSWGNSPRRTLAQSKEFSRYENSEARDCSNLEETKVCRRSEIRNSEAWNLEARDCSADGWSFISDCSVIETELSTRKTRSQQYFWKDETPEELWRQHTGHGINLQRTDFSSARDLFWQAGSDQFQRNKTKDLLSRILVRWMIFAWSAWKSDAQDLSTADCRLNADFSRGGKHGNNLSGTSFLSGRNGRLSPWDLARNMQVCSDHGSN